MAFIQPCFIKNSIETRTKLENIGISFDGYEGRDKKYIYINYGQYCNTYMTSDMVYNTINYHTNNGYEHFDYVDCDENEELFLALAALRDDTDKNQWFTDGKLWEKSNNDLPSHYMQLEGHKATIEEIVEHFK